MSEAQGIRADGFLVMWDMWPQTLGDDGILKAAEPRGTWFETRREARNAIRRAVRHYAKTQTSDNNRYWIAPAALVIP